MSDHFDGQRFFNPSGRGPRGLAALLRWQFRRKRGAWPGWVEHPGRPRLPERVAAGSCAVTFVNHVTFLLQFEGLNVLTDPVWAERVSPVSFAGPRRVHAPGIPFEALPRIDLILLSHNHYDHLDVATLRRLQAVHRPRIVTTLGNRAFLASQGIPGAEELDWWQASEPRSGVRVTVTPAQHFAARGLRDRCLTLWGGFALEVAGSRVYFAGDSGYFDGFAEIGRRLGPFDLSFLPIGAYEPRWFMEPMHCSPAEALRAHRDVRSRRSLAMHFGCFPLADDGFEQPVRDFEAARRAEGLTSAEFGVPAVGETQVYRLAQRG